jgi:hypothetical protein
MLDLYSYDNNELIINQPFSELWSIMKYRGKYIKLPEQVDQIVTKNPDKIVIEGKLHKDKKFHFDSNIHNIYGDEIQLSIDFQYEIEWEIKSKCKHINVGFYSPYRKFSNDRLYLNFDKNQNMLTKYNCHKGKILIDCHILTIALDKYHHDTTILLTINPIIKDNNNISTFHNIEYCKVKVFDVKQEGIYHRLVIKDEFKKLYKLVRKYYQCSSIKRSKHLANKFLLPKEIDYTNMLTKMSYNQILTFTSEIQPINDRVGYYGVIVKRDPNITSSATIYYQFELSNFIQTNDVIVIAAYYQPNEGYVPHQIFDKNSNKYRYVQNLHNGPYNDSNNLISGNLDLESTATDITLIITNSLYGILPIHGKDPNKIVRFSKFVIDYNNIDR